MDIFTLMIGRSLTIPFAINLERTEKRRQRGPELAAIDFALLSKAARELNSNNWRATRIRIRSEKIHVLPKLLAELGISTRNGK
jgi:hypothetical protein